MLVICGAVKPNKSPRHPIVSSDVQKSACVRVTATISGLTNDKIDASTLALDHSGNPPSALTYKNGDAPKTSALVMLPSVRLPTQNITPNLAVSRTKNCLNRRPTASREHSRVSTRFSSVSFTDGALRFIPLDLGFDYDIMEDEHGEQMVVCAADLQAVREFAEMTQGNSVADVPRTPRKTNEELVSAEGPISPELDDRAPKTALLPMLSTEDGFDTQIEDELNIPCEEDISVPIRVAALHFATPAKVVSARRPPTTVGDDMSVPRYFTTSVELDKITHSSVTNHALAGLTTALCEEDKSQDAPVNEPDDQHSAHVTRCHAGYVSHSAPGAETGSLQLFVR